MRRFLKFAILPSDLNENSMNCNPEILKLLSEKSSTKQFIFRQTKEIFNEFQKMATQVADELNNNICDIDANVVVEYQKLGDFEGRIYFSGDVVIYMMHTNVFTFEKNHFIWKSSYLKEDPMRGFFGVIYIYNFLADSFRYNRQGDFGYLMGRIMVNKDRHFFVEGKRQFSFLYNNLAEDILDEAKMRDIIEKSMTYALDFDLTTPDFNQMREVTVSQIEAAGNNLQLITRKKLGFQFNLDKDKLIG
jgi:hypothetical protein